MKKFEQFSLVQRAMTVAGLAPFILVGCAVHQQLPGAAFVPVPPRVSGPGATAQAAADATPVSAPVSVPAAVVQPMAPEGLTSTVGALSKNFDGIVGIAVTSVNDGWIVSAGGDRKLPQQSVSKLWVAMTVLDAVDQGRFSLDDPITITEADLTLFHQPVAGLIKDGAYRTTVGALMFRALTTSDNTANDRLLRHVGGPDVVRAFIAKKQLGEIRFGPGERLLQSKTAGLEWKPEYSKGNAFSLARAKLPRGVRLAAFDSYVADPPDGAAPDAIARALARLKKGELLSPASTSWLLNTMESSRTGKQRLRGAVPPGWTFGHKTGTGQDLFGHTAGYNDVGILTAPDGKSYTVAVMIGDTSRPIPERQDLMQAVVAAVVANHR
ncbi:MAG: serine hydrolase [Pseudomonadota bacterium]